MKIGKKLITWDDCEIIENDAKFRFEEEKEAYCDIMGIPQDSDWDTFREAFFNMDHSDTLQFEWEYLADYLTELIGDREYWFGEVNNFGWRSSNGSKYIHLKSNNVGSEFLSNILPKTDCQFNIFKHGKGFAIQNFHHDSPCGNEWYYLTPISYRTYENESMDQYRRKSA